MICIYPTAENSKIWIWGQRNCYSTTILLCPQFYNSLICHMQFNLCAHLSSELTTVSKENLYWKPEQPPPSTCSLRNSDPSAISNSLCQYRKANICEQCLLSIWIQLLTASKEWWAQKQNSGTECIAKLCQSGCQHFFCHMLYVPYLVSEVSR